MTGALSNKTVVITGAGRGIGRAYALAMAAEGARVVVNDLGVDLVGGDPDASPADAVVGEIRDAGGIAIANHDDISDSDAAGQLVAAAVGEFGGLDALVNNAAIEFRGDLETHSPGDWDRVMAVNARGTFNCVRQAAPVMREQGRGAIVNTTSGAFWEGTEGVAAYAASKAAVFALTLTQHSELARFGITSNAVAPGATRTRMVESWLEQLTAAGGGSEEELLAEYGIQLPENLAPLAITLCSDAGRDISGQVFEVWGDRIRVVSPPTRGRDLERTGDTWSLAALAKALPKLTS
jgi:NAD(P)-dependent dehydrogenase (short-subunit alcohol dehydrogenase family)